jgi:hypothetical protein
MRTAHVGLRGKSGVFPAPAGVSVGVSQDKRLSREDDRDYDPGQERDEHTGELPKWEPISKLLVNPGLVALRCLANLASVRGPGTAR